MINALTIDVEDYFMVSAFADKVRFEDWHRHESRIERNTYRILELLAEYKVKATFFVLGWIAEHYPQLIKDISSSGHEIASHGYNHRLIYDQTPDEFRKDIRKTKKILEDITGEPVVGYRATSFSVIKETLWALDILIEEGFKYDSSIFPIHHDRYGIPEAERFPHIIKRKNGAIMEFPPSTLRILGKNIPIGGGGYLRLLPIQFTEWGMRSINKKETRSAIVYFHPWEIDSEQPKLNGSRVSIFRHHVNIGKTFSKLKRLLRNFQFGTIKEIFSARLTLPVSFK